MERGKSKDSKKEALTKEAEAIKQNMPKGDIKNKAAQESK